MAGNNKWALITGASAGIGLEMAKLFAADHYNVVLVARNQARLKQLAGDLETRHHISARVEPKDLSRPEAAPELFDALRDTPISILVNNAGFGWRRAFADGEVGRWLEMMHVNMDALVQLTHLFAQPMRARREGRICNVASTAAFQPGPLTAIYFASKAFVYSFTVALADELAGSGVTVTAFCPGGTETEFFARAEMGNGRHRMYMMPADRVARIGYRALMKGKPIATAGLLNQASSSLAKCLPSRFTARIVRKMNGG
jgi:short-subunit dehydrogenase